jgi:hypothetical protein
MQTFSFFDKFQGKNILLATVKIRNERQAMLDSLKAQIDKRTLMHDDPETPKVQLVTVPDE